MTFDIALHEVCLPVGVRYVITKFSRMDSLPNFVTHGAPLARASRAQELRYYPDTILVAGLGQNQDTEDKRLDSYKKGYMRGQPDLLVLDYHKNYQGLVIEFKSPTGNYYVSEAQKEMKKK